MADKKPKLLRVTTHDISLDGLLPGQLRYLNRYFEVVGVAADTGVLQKVARREGVRVAALPMRREIALGADMRCLWRMYRLLRRERPDIVHANTPKGSLLSMVAGWAARVPHRVYTVTGLRYQGAGGWLRSLLQAMERVTCRFATDVIPEGRGVKAALEADRITRKPLRIVLNGNINGIDTEHFAPEALLLPGETPADARARLRREFGLPADGFVFVFVGRIVGDKGMNELATAMRALAGRCKLLLVGPLEPELDPLQPESLKTFMESTDVSAVGMQRDVRPYLLAADVLVFPSYREGFPNVVLQAGAMGLPAIVTDINGCNEIIRSGENGVIIPPGDAEALIRAMQRFIDRPERVSDMAARARSMITSRYRQQDVWDALLARYREMLQQRR